MDILLPSYPPAALVSPTLVKAGREAKGPMQSASQRIQRHGSRWAFDVDLEDMLADDVGGWGDVEHETAVLGWIIPQPWLDIGEPGSPVVDGADQMGALVNLRGFAPGYQLKKNQWVSFNDQGRRYTHRVTADVVADATGRLALAIRPMLRELFADGVELEVKEPKITGFVTHSGLAMAPRSSTLKGFSFTIKEV